MIGLGFYKQTATAAPPQPGGVWRRKQVIMDTTIVLLYHLLTWSDFRGVPKPNSTHSAHTCYVMCMDHKTAAGVTHYYAYAAFDQHESWTRSNSASTLIHEQGHLDICEVYARQLNTELADVHDEKEALRLYNEAFTACQETEATYEAIIQFVKWYNSNK